MAVETHTSVGFRARTVSPGLAISQQIQKGLKSQRNYQRQHVSINGLSTVDVIAPGGFGSYSVVPLMGSDQVVSAIASITVNTPIAPLGIEVNTVDQTTALGGPWASLPVNINLKALAVPKAGSDVRMYVRLINKSGSVTTTACVMLQVVLLR